MSSTTRGSTGRASERGIGGTATHATAAEQPDGPGGLARFAIDPASGTPPFRQLHDAVVDAVSTRELAPGERLPTVRALAARLGLAVNTVAASYKSLEQAGIVEGRGRAGTFVRLGDDPVEAQARRVALEAADALERLGIDEARAARILTEAVRATRRA